MKILRSEPRPRPSIERAFAIRRDLRSKAEAVKWENSLSDWEWIMLWASIYSGEAAAEKSSLKQ